MHERHKHLCISFPINDASHFFCHDDNCIRPEAACWVCDECLTGSRKLIPRDNRVEFSPEK